MSGLNKLSLLVVLIFAAATSFAQSNAKGKIIDATTKEPVFGATIHCTENGCRCGCTTNSQGEFEMRCTDCHTLAVTYVGYTAQQFTVSGKDYIVAIDPVPSPLQAVVLTANRGEGAKRSEAPVAITTISSKTLQDAKPTTVDQVLNKVSGVNMVNLGNEQHQMSIRQPMTTKSLFLYLEDGIPIRTSGLFNHNALLEINMTATKSIEVIKGPSSSLYGSEAIGGVVNFLTSAPTAVPVLKLSTQGNNVGYKRADLVSSISSGKWGFLLSGYYADKRNGYLEYTDFQKGTLTARVDYRFSASTTLSNRLTYLHYYSDMAGGIDSAMFAKRTFSNPQTFTYRKVEAVRYHSTLTHVWNDNSKSTITALYRENGIGQNPAYRVKDDYRRINGVYTGKKDLAHGEINRNSFHSYSVIAQHRQNLPWKKAVLMGGLNIDISPSTYRANYIRIKKDTVAKKYVNYQSNDSTLTDYATKLNNYAAFLNFEFNPISKLRVVASLRYDYFHYSFDNHLKPSAYSGSPDTLNHFQRVSPKIGFTYNFSGRTGIYANYSEGFVPPQVTELYTGVKVPNLNPSIFYNYEIGGWAEIIKNKLSVDASLYRLQGTNEIVSVKLDDGSFANQNAGRTLHRGIEAGLNATPASSVTLRVSGAYSKHEFLEYVEKGAKYSGNEMANAPRWTCNAEVWYKPSFAKGLRLGAEWQHVGRYFVDPQNTATYNGYQSLNLRAGYQLKGFDVWVNVLNATNNYYSYITSKSAFGYSYQLAEPRNFNVGVSYDFANLFKKNQ
jgi:outer membrane receptor protein involved in Fe transport